MYKVVTIKGLHTFKENIKELNAKEHSIKANIGVWDKA